MESIETMQQRDFFKPGRSVAISDKGMAATSHPLATLAAVDILRAGGNAVDAAVASVALQSVIDPHMTGIGGDCFALYSAGGGTPVGLNGSGRAPKKANLDYFLDKGFSAIPDDSPHAVTIPGAIDAWCRLIGSYGRLGMDRVLAPAIAAAEEGYCVTPRVELDWRRYSYRVAKYPQAAAYFLPNGKAPRTGDRIANPALAATLRAVARDGRNAFYRGPVAEEITALLQSLGGLHEESDFADYKAFDTKPISGKFRGRDLLECPPNGQGLAALLITRILDGFDLRDPKLSEADRIHLHAEATKAGYAMRDQLICDPDHLTFDIDELLSDRSVAAMRAKISLERAADTKIWDGPTHRDTVYVSVVDRDGNSISLINSVFMAFGSGIYAPRSGVLLQNRGAGFVVKPGHPNAIGPGKLPFHTIIPAMLMENGKVRMSFGVMGGQYQAAGHAHMLTQILDRDLDPQQASDQPRSFSFGGKLSLEPTISEETRRDLERRGHVVEWSDEPIGGAQAIMIDHERGILLGASDHRKDGMALGY
ncbi:MULTISPECIES: gamma-glutamyltransferase [unclassified Rhizobium]|uniref:gamma-glutamyltransferase n=2 Tax=Rhizobium TaxID=379 RepID=UPI001813699D|nr:MULTISPECIES: gamma-glutamyltransferase [unclassified Rhizobium]MBB3484488.1 gamma-glutamyltranspeptidase/glutathione hydrolase [Rhizobium sp. BK347]